MYKNFIRFNDYFIRAAGDCAASWIIFITNSISYFFNAALVENGTSIANAL
jgi:hypothetical protein